MIDSLLRQRFPKPSRLPLPRQRGRSRLHLARLRRGGLKTNHVAFRPIEVKMGSDGAIDIADWYNPIIQHGEVDFRDRRRDHPHGRI